MDPDARQDQLIALAVDLAEEQLRNGTASSQVITHYLKLGSSKERLEQEMLKKQMELVGAKTEALQSAKRIEELSTQAIQAMRMHRAGLYACVVRQGRRLPDAPPVRPFLQQLLACHP